MVVPQGQATSSATTLNIAQNAFISNTVTIPIGPPVIYVPPPPAAPATTITENIDAPAAGSTVSGTIVASGWALNSQAALTGVNVYIDGTFYKSAQIGYTRSDVCALYSSPVCPNVGWVLAIDTTQFADGNHTISITALSTNGSDYSVAQSFSILNDSSPASYPFHGSIDAPGANLAYRGTVTFSGWDTYANGTISSVNVYVDGALQGTGVTNARADVCALYPVPGCPSVGWSLTLDTNTFATGTHTLTTKATSSDGQTYVLSQPFHHFRQH
jgi:N-acetylmuramoyl-L-alanine amidase